MKMNHKIKICNWGYMVADSSKEKVQRTLKSVCRELRVEYDYNDEIHLIEFVLDEKNTAHMSFDQSNYWEFVWHKEITKALAEQGLKLIECSIEYDPDNSMWFEPKNAMV